jgi:hypothetical protein
VPAMPCSGHAYIQHGAVLSMGCGRCRDQAPCILVIMWLCGLCLIRGYSSRIAVDSQYFYAIGLEQ